MSTHATIQRLHVPASCSVRAKMFKNPRIKFHHWRVATRKRREEQPKPQDADNGIEPAVSLEVQKGSRTPPPHQEQGHLLHTTTSS